MLTIIMITSPALVDASAVLAGKLIIGTWLRRRTVVQSYVLISTVNAIWIAIAKPFLRNTLRSSPGLVLLACELSFGIAFAII